jgi:ubiquinone/menaquinone biosynthesis C-methylase UbiE
VLEHLVPVRGKRVLEIACGRGGFLPVLASLGASVWGSDFSDSAVQIARKQADSSRSAEALSLVQADAHHLPYAENSFDVIISCETIEHLLDPSAALNEMERVCRPGGWLFLTTPNYLNLMGLYQIYVYLFKRRRPPVQGQPLDRTWVFTQVRHRVRKAGWKIVHFDGTVHQVPIPGRNPVPLAFLEGNRRIRRALSPFALHNLIVARKRGLPE